MNLLHLTAERLGWLRALTVTVGAVTPVRAGVAVVARIASQVFVLLTFMLPMKLVLLVAQDGVPSFLTPLVTPANKDLFVALTTAGAASCYGLYHLSNWTDKNAIAAGAAQLMAQTGKLHIFDNQDEIARQGYHRVVDVLASIIQALLFLVLGWLLDDVLWGAFAVVIVLEYSLVAVLLALPGPVSRGLAGAFENRFGTASGVLVSLNYLAFMALLLARFMTSDALHPVVAIVSIIMMRQMLQKVKSVLAGLAYLAKNRLRLKALFYTSVQYVPQAGSGREELEPERRDHWLPQALSDATGSSVQSVKSRWVDSGRPGLVYLDVTAGDGGARYFVKYYERHALHAAHEAHLFASHPEGIPRAPRYLGDTFIGKSRLMVFEGVSNRRPQGQGSAEAKVRALLDAWTFTLDEGLVDAYLRTHRLVSDRLDPEFFGRVSVAADAPDDRASLDALYERWGSIRALIAEMPLVLRNPGLSVPANWFLDDRDKPRCLSWERWGLGPLGCDSALLRIEEEVLRKELAARQEAGTLSAAFGVDRVLLVARVIALEEAVNRNQLRTALDLVTAIVKCHQGLYETDEGGRELSRPATNDVYGLDPTDFAGVGGRGV